MYPSSQEILFLGTRAGIVLYTASIPSQHHLNLERNRFTIGEILSLG